MTGARTSENMSPGLLRVMERKPLGFSMSRISGGAVWSNCPRTDLARAPAERLAGATLLYNPNPLKCINQSSTVFIPSK